jgi:hypothetical protein
MPATRRAALAAAAIPLLLAAGCTTAPEPGAPSFGGRPPIRLAVGSVDVQSQVQSLPLQFIDARRTDRLVAATTDYLKQRIQAAGGSGTARAVIEQASLLELRAAPSGIAGAITGGPVQLAGTLAVRVAVVDGAGVEKAYARAKVDLKRPVPEGSSVVQRDRLTRALMNDLIETLDQSLRGTVKENLGAYLAGS